ncbi:MAG: ATP-binding cassette domain-containing protein, partial [Proteobacteria bacterium]|nr:ATP-binding cassette domain-containing protein [Pseudomonadota bacterium]
MTVARDLPITPVAIAEKVAAHDGAHAVHAARPVGDVLLSVENVSLSFGGVRAISDVSFDIRKGEIRAIIGPNGAGKTSMLNVINGFYYPQQGVITFKGQKRREMRPYFAATSGISRTFQNVALFKGMTTLDN